MDFQKILDEIQDEIQPFIGQGAVADYIPALARVPADRFGLALKLADGTEYTVGDATIPFSIQSVSKLFSLMLAMDIMGEDLWRRVGREPSGTAFNSLVQLEYEDGIPRNPFINAGAIVVTDVIASHSANAPRRVADFVRQLSGNAQNRVDEEVALSEWEHGYRNAALANLLRSFDNIHGDVDTVLDVYFRQCAITMNCLDLARAVQPLVLGGYSPVTKSQVLSGREAKRVNALMLTCGLYDAVGSFAYEVGLPAKSGVGGGIVAVLPGELSIAVWSPELDKVGNSLAGTRALELFTTKTGLSIF